MPTENRSSNTEMVSVPRDTIEFAVGFTRHGYKSQTDQKLDQQQAQDQLRAILAAPAQHPHPEPIAWMVGTAFWWTKEEAERDAAETGLPIVGLGPMTDSAEVERLREALKFYADRDHFAEDIGSDWDSVSGEPANVLWHDSEAWFVEDGSIARAALSATPDSLQLA
ncbi:hypothetical protein [Pseudomonas sp. 43(2021)]|uniref:hypothetical protein n=1 Tax=Pseudomonas sp. 43(2021) TaxID=2813560 RepID=UPI001A9FE8D2|nr:hypothetical protein [Pseudomonas sp. 43(2021)]